jgi:hypothetical protein
MEDRIMSHKKPPELTIASITLFFLYRADAPNWGGTPPVGSVGGNISAQRGNLTQLKKFGLVETFVHDGETFVRFTAKGEAFAGVYKAAAFV